MAAVRHLLQRLSASSVPLSAKVHVCLGWAVALFVVVLVPLDVVVVRARLRARPASLACAGV